VWFTEYSGNQVGRITPNGAITEFPVPTDASAPAGIAAGPDGNVWFVELYGDKVGRIAPSGVITEFAIPTKGTDPQGMTSFHGAVWFTELNGSRFGKVSMSGVVKEFIIPPVGVGVFPSDLAPGADGESLWITEYTYRIAEYRPSP
jgi:virginiamycin B lyase